MANFPTAGATFGEYELTKVLGRGGFSTVFAATDQRDGSILALKVLKHDARNGYAPQTKARFEREIAVHQTLVHPSTVRMYGHGEINGFLYAALEIVEGVELRALVADGPLPTADAAAILVQILGALAEAHSRGLLHRDLKPDNIRVSGISGAYRATLLDFGIARPTDDSHPAVTRTGELIGTPRYMSPEQLGSKLLTPASDVYSLGVVATEMLCGQAAMHGNAWLDQTERLIAGYEFPELATHDTRLADVVKKMRALRPADRYPNAGAALAALLGHAEKRYRAASPTTNRNGKIGLAVLAVALSAVVFVIVNEPEPEKPIVVINNAGGLGLTKATQVVPDAPPPDAVTKQPNTVFLPGGRPSSGCGLPAPSEDLIYLPKDYDPNYAHPVVVLMHSDWQPPENLLQKSGFRELADVERFVVIAPEDRMLEAWRTFAAWGRVEPQLQQQFDRLCLDQSRVYLASNGDAGHAAVPLACGDSFTAVGVWASAEPVPTMKQDCAGSERTAPVLWMAPSDSKAFPADGGMSCRRVEAASLREIEEFWAERHVCRLAARPPLKKISKSTCWEHECEGAFTSCLIQGGALWPGMLDAAPDLWLCPHEPPTNYPMAAKMWEFFQKAGHARAAEPASADVR